MAFKVGDVVKLKSEGPDMTVCKVDEKLTCMWFNQNGDYWELSYGEFYPDTVQEVSNSIFG